VFSDGPLRGRRARTLRQFVGHVEPAPSEALDGHLKRGDFSRWIGDVFGDNAVASELASKKSLQAW
jgi:hypothetical protein